MNPKEYKFRASQMGKIMAGTIGLTERQHEKLEGYVRRAWNARNGNDKPLTQNMQDDMNSLFDIKRNPEIPKTMRSELIKIWRAETYNRNFTFTNKYVQKGILQEEEAITLFMMYKKTILKERCMLTKNDERFYDDFFQGEPDIFDQENHEIGYDTKCSWGLDTFPLETDELDPNYEVQNQVYMHLTGRKEWWTVYCLVNATEHLLNNEKLKRYYAYESPGQDDKFYEQMIRDQKDCEIALIFDYDRFVDQHPFHDMLISKKEWHKNGLQIPLEDRVVIKKSFYNPELIEQMKERIKISRAFFAQLNGKK